MRRVYLDYAAGIGNPSSVHTSGREAKRVLDDARLRVGKVLNCRPEELVFTGSGTEANNLAIFGFPQDSHMISTNIEHHSVLRPLQKRGNVTFVPVKSNGIVDPGDIARAIKPNTVLVSIIYANNEIGTIQPIRAIKKVIGEVLLHTDACQAAGYLDINVQNLGVDLMTVNGAKVYGPQGTGALFVRRGVRLSPMILGGDQERGLRAGTENPELLSEFAKALELAEKKREKESKRLAALRDWMIGQIITEIPDVKLNGDPISRLPNNINISFKNIDGEMLMLTLDLKGIEVSTGSACTVTSNEPSHVLQAIGQTDGNIRMTLGRDTNKKDLEYTLEVLKQEVARLRAL